MAKIILDMAMSLDGFVADRNGNSIYPIGKSLDLVELIATTGAVVMDRPAYDMANGDFTGYEYQVPIFVLTLDVPKKVAEGENKKLTFTFITNGIESAIEKAVTTAGKKNVMVIGVGDVPQQCIKAGLVDEIVVRLMPFFLGEGLRLFERIGTKKIELEKIRIEEFPTRTDIRFRVIK
jgi:dihydrofolate reductase